MGFNKVVKYLAELKIDDDSKFSLRDDGNSLGVFIEKWDYEVPKPDLSTLPDMTADELDEDNEKRILLDKLDDIVIVALKQKQIDKFENKIKLFSLIYNKTAAALQLKTKNGWKVVVLA